MRKAVQEQLADWKDSFIECRDEGHLWRRMLVFENQFGEAEREYICRRCSTSKRTWTNRRTGESLGTRYSYPKGYLKSKGDYSVSRQDVRVEALNRLLEGVKSGR